MHLYTTIILYRMLEVSAASCPGSECTSGLHSKGCRTGSRPPCDPQARLSPALPDTSQPTIRPTLPGLPPDVNRSRVRFTTDSAIDGKPAIRFGLASVKNVGESAVSGLVAERLANGNFASLADFARRAGTNAANRRVLESLARVGALDELGGSGLQVDTDILPAVPVQHPCFQAIMAGDGGGYLAIVAGGPVMPDREATGFSNLLGLDISLREPGHAVGTLDIESLHMNRAGLVHGGVLMTMLDTLMGWAANSDPSFTGEFLATSRMTTHFLEAVRSGPLSGEGWVTASTAGYFIAEAEIRDSKDQLVATASAQFTRVRRR
ncbi:MAG: hotdog fold thioesterase [Myxococcales bacterium]|nr:hotdog fold thioesterase [Myxococcales bacterium]